MFDCRGRSREAPGGPAGVGAVGGNGGGIVLIASPSISVNVGGAIRATGGGGALANAASGGGGGGSGGSVVLEAGAVLIRGTVTAAGGFGSGAAGSSCSGVGGSGGGGRVRLFCNTYSTGVGTPACTAASGVMVSTPFASVDPFANAF